MGFIPGCCWLWAIGFGSQVVSCYVIVLGGRRGIDLLVGFNGELWLGRE